MKRPALLTAVALALASTTLHAAPAKRAVPDYDGREDSPPSALDTVAWIPRILLFPARIVVDYGVRRPLGFVVTKAEGSKTFRAILRRLFREVEEANPLIYPVALVDFGFNDSIGARVVFRRGMLIPNSDVTLRLGTGGLDWWRADVSTKTRYSALRVRTNIGANNRPDYLFHGIGPYTPPEARARYGARTAGASMSWGGAIENVGELSVHGGLSDVNMKPSRFNGDLTIDQQVAAGRIAELPAGYTTDYRLARFGGRLTLDTRYEGRRAASGARMDVGIERVTDLIGPESWTRLDLMVGGALLLDASAERKLDVRVGVQSVHSQNLMDIPFPELPSLTGLEWMRGLPGGRVRGYSSAAILLDYHWPVAAWLDAHAHLGAGNVYGRALSGFSLASLRGSFGGSLTIAGLTDRQIGVALAYGTEPLGGDFDVSSYRFIVEYSGDY